MQVSKGTWAEKGTGFRESRKLLEGGCQQKRGSCFPGRNSLSCVALVLREGEIRAPRERPFLTRKRRTGQRQTVVACLETSSDIDTSRSAENREKPH